MHRKGRVIQSEKTARAKRPCDGRVHGEDWGLKIQICVSLRKSVEESRERGGWRGGPEGAGPCKQVEGFIFGVKRNLCTVLLRDLG